MSSIQQIQKEIIEEFSLFDDWTQRYEYMIDLGKSLPLINEKYKNDKFIIKGCQSKVWVNAELENKVIKFTADSDAIITKGIIALLIRVLNHQPPRHIIDAELNFINKIGLTNHLSPTRANGLLEMVKQMKAYAYSLMIKNK